MKNTPDSRAFDIWVDCSDIGFRCLSKVSIDFFTPDCNSGRFVASRGKSAVFELALELALQRLKSAGAGGGPLGGFPAPSAINFGVQGSAASPSFPVPVGNTGKDF